MGSRQPRSGALGARSRQILLISEYFPPRVYGGGEISTELLARGIARRGFEVDVLTSGGKGLAEVEKVDGVTVIRRLRTGPSPHSILHNVLRVVLLPFSIRRLAAEMTAAKAYEAVLLLNATSIVGADLPVPTIAVVNGYTPFCPKGNLYFQERSVCEGCAPGKLVSCLTRSEYVGLSRLTGLLRFNPLFWLAIYSQYRMRRRALNTVDRFVAISGFVSHVLRRHGIAVEQIERIYNLAEIEDNEEVPPELERLCAGKRVVAVIGTLSRSKRVDMAIRAFAIWRSKSDRMLVIGDGPERQGLQRLSRELGVADHVLFTGQVEACELPYIYRNAHAVVLPSQWPEPFSRVVMEAAYHRRPLLVSDRGGNRDLPAEHRFSTVEELASKLDQPPVPSFSPYRPEANLERFVELLDRLAATRDRGRGAGRQREST